jgi:hypothetical protein
MEGDLTSAAKGSGARLNAGKEPMDLVPIRFWRLWWEQEYALSAKHPSIAAVILALEAWQEQTRPSALEEAWESFPYNARADVVKVLEFGSEKYAAWNWAKGQRWGCTLASLLRHVKCLLEEGEILDKDSGLPHWGHIGCNIMFLLWFAAYYPEGDDRPPTYRSQEGKEGSE